MTKHIAVGFMAVVLLAMFLFCPAASGDFGDTVLFAEVGGDSGPDMIIADADAGTGGEVYILLDPEVGNLTVSDADITITGEAGSRFGAGVTLTDMDDDNVTDLIVGAPNSTDGNGTVYVFLGPLSNGSYLDANVTIEAPDDVLGFGASVEATEINDDGRPDLAIASIYSPEGNGLVGSYYDDIALSELQYVQVDDGIAFNWGMGSPSGLGADTFSIRWNGLLFCDETGAHTFWADANDAIRVWIDGDLLIDEWGGAPNASGSAYLLEGYHDIRVEYADDSMKAFVNLNWTTPYASGPILTANFVPSIAYPITLVKGKTNVSNLEISDILVESVGGSTLGAVLHNTSHGLAVGSPSVGRVYVYDGATSGSVDYFTARPSKKGSNDNTGSNLNDLKTDNNQYYQVERGSDEDDLEVDEFDVSDIGADYVEFGEVVSVTLYVGYYTDHYYLWQGNGDENAVLFAVEGESYADTFTPEGRDTEIQETFNLYNEGVTSIAEVADLNIAFTNGDSGSSQDSVYFDYIVVVIGMELPVLKDPIQGPPSFGTAIASDGDVLYVGAPFAGPLDNDLELVGMSGGGSAYSFDMTSLPVAAADADGILFGTPGSAFGSSVAASDGVLAVGAPGAFLDARTGAVFLAEGMDLVGSGLCPYNTGTAGAAVAMNGSLLAAGNPAIGTVHLIDTADAPVMDIDASDTVYIPTAGQYAIDISSTGVLNITSFTIPAWDSDFNGSEWIRMSAGSVDLDVNVPTAPGIDTPVTVVGRSDDGLTSGLDVLWIRALEEAYSVEDLHILRADGKAFASPGGGVGGETSTVRPFIGYSGPGSAATDITISTGGTYLNRTVPMPSDLVILGDNLMVSSYGVDAWRAADQMGGSVATSAVLEERHYSWRVIVNGSYLLQRGDSVRLEFYTPVELGFDQVSIAVAGGDDRNIFDETLTEVSFGGAPYYVASAGELFYSDWIDFALEPDMVYAVSFHTQTRSENRVTYLYGSDVGETYSRIGDYRSDRDWSDNAPTSSAISAYLISIESETYPFSVGAVSMPGYSPAGWNFIGWTATVPEGAEVRASIRTADDVGGMPANWSDWHGPAGEDHYLDPAPISEPSSWIQYKVDLVSTDGENVPVLHRFYLGTSQGDWIQDSWTSVWGPEWGSGDLAGFGVLYSVESLWTGDAGYHNITVEVGGESGTFMVEMETDAPNGDVDVLGRTSDIQGYVLSGTSISLTNLRTGSMLNTTSNGSGDYSLNLSLLSGGFRDGDGIIINASHMGSYGTLSFRTYSGDGDRWTNLTLELEGLEVFIEAQDTPFGQSHIRMYRESDGAETDTPVEGEDTLLTARIGNRGQLEAINVTVGFFDNGSLIGTAQVLSIASGDVTEIQQWWTPLAGWTNLSVKAWGMWNTEHYFWADLWDSPWDWGGSVDFTTEAYNTPDDLNTWGFNQTDMNQSMDGWDWLLGAYGVDDDRYIDFGEPGGDADEIVEGHIEIQIGKSGGNNQGMSGYASGAFGTQFYIEPDDFSEWAGGKVIIRFDWTWNVWSGTEERASLLGQLRSDDDSMWLGNDTSTAYWPNSSAAIHGKEENQDVNTDWYDQKFSQDVTSMFNDSGHYYLDLGLWVDDTTRRGEGVTAEFDDISLEFVKEVYDQFPENDEGWMNVTILPNQPVTPFNATVHFIDNYNHTGLRVNFTAFTDSGSWSLDARTNGTGYYHIGIPAINYTETDLLTIDIDDILDGVRFFGGDSMILYSYESPVDIQIPLFSYGFNMTPLNDQAVLSPGESFDYTLEVVSDSNVGVDIYLNVTGLSPGWRVTLSGDNVNRSSGQYRVWVGAFSSVTVTARLTLDEEPLKSLPGNYTWTVDGGAWFGKDTVTMMTDVIPVYTFEILDIDMETIDPGETLFYNVTIRSTGNVANVLDFNLTAPDNWTIVIPNTALPLAASRTENLVFYVTAPDWPGEDLIGGTGYNLTLIGVSRYSADSVDTPVEMEIGGIHEIILKGSDMECEPGVAVFYPINITNDGNVRETVSLVLEWNATIGNVSTPYPVVLDSGEWYILDIVFTPSSDYNVSTAGRVMAVNASFGDSLLTMRFMVERVYDIDFIIPDTIETVIDQETRFEVTVENRGNGDATYKIEIDNGVSDTPFVQLFTWLPENLGVSMTPDAEGWSNVTLSLVMDSATVGQATIPVKVSRGYIDFVMGEAVSIIDDVEAYDVSPFTGDIAYISGGAAYYLPDNGTALDLGATNATDIAVTNMGSTYVALAEPGTIRVLEISENAPYTIARTWNMSAGGTAVELDSSQYSDDGYAVYMIWIAPGGVKFRSLSNFQSNDWNTAANIWSGTATAIDILASGSRINIAWGGSSGVHYERVSYLGSEDIAPVRVANVPPPTSVALSNPADIHLAWASNGMVSYVTYNGSWSSPTELREGFEVSGALAGGITSFAISEDFVSVVHPPAGYWQASERSNVSSPTLVWNDGLQVYYLDDDLWVNEVDLPPVLDWGETRSIDITLHNRGSLAKDVDPVMSLDADWSGTIGSDFVPSGGTGAITLTVQAPYTISSVSSTDVIISLDGVEMMRFPALAIGDEIHELAVEGSIAAIPGESVETTITFVNTGNSPENVTVDIIVPEGWEIVLDTDTLTIPAGGTGSVGITITAPADTTTQDDLSVNLTYAGNTTTVMAPVAVELVAPEIVGVDFGTDFSGETIVMNATVYRADTVTWYLPDGSEATGLSVNVIFDMPGNASVQLIATNDAGVDSRTMIVPVLNRLPIGVDFETGRLKAGESLLLIANGTDPEGTRLTFTWTVEGKEFTGASIDYHFEEKGTYKVTLTAEDEHGGTAEITHNVVVTGGGGGGVAGMDMIDLVLLISLILLLLILLLLLAKRRKAPEMVKSLKDESMFEMVHRLWPQYVDTVRDLDPKVADILEEAKVLNYDESTNVLTLGLAEGENFKRAAMPEVLEVMERGFHDLHGTRVFLFIESGPGGTPDPDAGPTLTLVGDEPVKKPRKRTPPGKGGPAGRPGAVKKAKGPADGGIGRKTAKRPKGKGTPGGGRAERTAGARPAARVTKPGRKGPAQKGGRMERPDGAPTKKVAKRKGPKGPFCLALMIMMFAVAGMASGEQLTLADIDSDGYVDVVAGFPDEDSAGYAAGPLSRGSVTLTTMNGPTGSGFGYAVASTNGTLAVMAHDGETTMVYTYSALGAFGSFDDNTTTIAPSGVNSLAVGDYDADGEVDIAVASSDGTVRLYYGPTYDSSMTLELPDSDDIALVLEDLDGNGGEELVVGVPSIGIVFLFEGGVDYETQMITPDLEGIVSDVNLSWEGGGLQLERLGEIENGDGSEGLTGWWTTESRDGQEAGTIRLLDGNVGDWLVSPNSGAPTVGFGSTANDIDGANSVYSGILCSPSFTIPDDVEYLHLWYRYDLDSFDSGEGVYVDIYNAQNDNKLIGVTSWRSTRRRSDNTWAASTTVEVSNFRGYTLYLGAELDGNDASDAGLVTMDDLYFSDKDGNVARKSEGYYSSSATTVGFNISSILPVWDADLNGEVLEIRARASSDVPWGEIVPLVNSVQNEVTVPGTSFEFNITLRSGSAGTSPVLKELTFELLSAPAGSIKGKEDTGFGSSLDVSGDDGIMIVGAPLYFSRGTAFTFGVPESGESFTIADASSFVSTNELDTGLGTGVALADLTGDGSAEVLVSAPDDRLRTENGGAIYGFKDPSGEISIKDSGIQFAGSEGLGTAMASTWDTVAVLEDGAISVIKGWHGFRFLTEDGSSFPDNTISIPIAVENLYDAEQIELDLVLPGNWTGHYDMGGTVSSISISAGSTVNLTLVIDIPADADDKEFTIVLTGVGDDGMTYNWSSLTVEVFIPDLYPNYLFMLRGDGRNVTDDSKHLIAKEIANVTVEFYTISNSPLPEVTVTFFEEYNTGSVWEYALIENVTVLAVPDGRSWASVNWTPYTDGEFYIGAVIDSQNVILETDEDNTIKYKRTILDEVPDVNYTIGGKVYDTDNTTVNASITVTGASGFTTMLTSNDNGDYSVIVDDGSYLEGEVFWINATLTGPPGAVSESIGLYSEDASVVLDLDLWFDGVDVALEPFDDATGTVDISVLRYGDGAPGETVVAGLPATLEIEIKNRGRTAVPVNASFWTNVSIGSVVRTIEPLTSERLNITWTPAFAGMYDLFVRLNATGDLYAMNDDGTHASIVCIPQTPSIDTWINGTVLDTEGKPLAGVQVPLENIDRGWTNNTITTNATGWFSTMINASSYLEGDRIDLNVTHGENWGNLTIHLFSYDGAHNVTLMLRKYGVSLTGETSTTVMPWVPATYLLNLTNTANFNDTFTVRAIGLPSGWDHVFLYGNGTIAKPFSMALDPAEWFGLSLIMWTDTDPRTVLPDTYDITVIASMDSHPSTSVELLVSLEVLRTYNFTMTGVNTSWSVAPDGMMEFEYELTNWANGDVTLLVSAFSDEPDVGLDYPTSITIGYGETKTLILEATAPPLSPDLLAGSDIEITLKVVAFNDSLMDCWDTPTMTLEGVVKLEWSGTTSKEVIPGEEAAFALVLTNVGNAVFSGNTTIGGAEFYVTAYPDGVVLGPGNSETFLVIAVADFKDQEGDYLPSGSIVDFNVSFDNLTTELSITSLPKHSISISSNEISVWTHYTDVQVFEIVVRNRGNVAEDVTMFMAGENAAWAELSEEELTLSVGEVLRLNLTVEPDGPGTCDLSIFGSSDHVVSNSLFIFVAFDRYLDQALLYSSASMIVDDADEFASSGDAVLWRNSSGIYVLSGGETHFLGDGTRPAIGTFGDSVAAAWVENGMIQYATSSGNYVAREVTNLTPVRMDVAPGPVKAVAVDTGSALKVFTFAAGNWTQMSFPRGDFALIPHGDELYLLYINSTNASLRTLPSGDIVEELQLDGIDHVLIDDTIAILGEEDGSSVLLWGEPGDWTTSSGPSWGEALVSTQRCPIAVGYSEGELMAVGGCGLFTMPMRPTWPLVQMDGGYLPPAPTSDLGGGDSVYYISNDALFRLPLDIIVRPDENGGTFDVILYGATEGLEPTIEGDASIVSWDVNATTGAVTVTIMSDPVEAGVSYPVFLSMEGENGTTNPLGFIMVPRSYIIIDVLSVEGDIMPGDESSVVFEVVNNGTGTEYMTIGFTLPEGWTADHDSTIGLEPGEKSSFTVVFTAPLVGSGTGITVHLNGTENREFTASLAILTPSPRAVMLSLDEAVSLRSLNFIAEEGYVDNWTWTFGDGSVVSGRKVSHAFARPGVYMVTLTVRNSIGVDRAYKNVTITNQIPEVRIEPVKDQESGEVVQIEAAGTTDRDGTIVSYTWTFSDGGTASGAVISHKFSTTGINVINLTVTDELGGTNWTTIRINVTSKDEGLSIGDLAPKIGMIIGIIILAILIILVLIGKVGLKRKPSAKVEEPTVKKPLSRKPPAGAGPPKVKMAKRPTAGAAPVKVRKVKKPAGPKMVEDAGTIEAPEEEAFTEAPPEEEVPEAPSAFVPMGQKEKPVLPSGPAEEEAPPPVEERGSAFITKDAARRPVLPTMSEEPVAPPVEEPPTGPPVEDVPAPATEEETPVTTPEPPAMEESPAPPPPIEEDAPAVEDVDETEISSQLDDLDALMKKLDGYTEEEE